MSSLPQMIEAENPTATATPGRLNVVLGGNGVIAWPPIMK